MDVLEAIRTRRNVRKYSDQPVHDDVIQQLLSAAMMAPSARNAQPWQFVVINDTAEMRLLRTNQRHPGKSGDFRFNAVRE